MASKPKRFQRLRTKGWRKPEGGIICDRTSHYGNPYRIGDPHPIQSRAITREDAVILFRISEIVLDADSKWECWLLALRGHDLGCTCKLDEACHVDVLIELANK